MALISPTEPTIAAPGLLPCAFGAVVVAHVQQQAAVFQFSDFALIDLVARGAATKLPGCAGVIAVDHVRVVALALSFDVIARDDQAARVHTALQLDSGTRAGRIPSPCRKLCAGRDVLRRGPGVAMIGAAQDPNRARAF